MRLPRDISGQDLIKALRFFGYVVTRQKGTHVRVSTTRDGEHHETIPVHTPIKVGTLSSILKSVAAHHGVTVEQVLAELGL